MFFDGAISNWYEMPKPDDTSGMGKVYAYLRRINEVTSSKMFFMSSLRKIIKGLHM